MASISDYFRERKLRSLHKDDYPYSEQENKNYITEFEPKINDFLSKLDSKELKFSGKAYQSEVHVENSRINRDMKYNIAFIASRSTYDSFKHVENKVFLRRITLQELWNYITAGNSNDYFEPGEAYEKKLNDELVKNAELELRIEKLDNRLRESENAKGRAEQTLQETKDKIHKIDPDLYKELFPEYPYKSDLEAGTEE